MHVAGVKIKPQNTQSLSNTEIIRPFQNKQTKTQKLNQL